MHSRLVFSLSLLVVSACGGGAPAPAAPEGPPPAPPPTASAPSAEPAAPPSAVAWKDMNREQRLEYMKKSVLPQMKEEFSAFDSKRFGGMSCPTCHRSGTKGGSFKMPTADLPKLNAEGNFKKHREKTPEILDFMLTKVEPDMAKLLGEPPYDPKTHQGFSCFRCHTQE